MRGKLHVKFPLKTDMALIISRFVFLNRVAKDKLCYWAKANVSYITPRVLKVLVFK